MIYSYTHFQQLFTLVREPGQTKTILQILYARLGYTQGLGSNPGTLSHQSYLLLHDATHLLFNMKKILRSSYDDIEQKQTKDMKRSQRFPHIFGHTDRPFCITDRDLLWLHLLAAAIDTDIMAVVFEPGECLQQALGRWSMLMWQVV